MYIDQSYRTVAGTAFYNRLEELRILIDKVRKCSFTIIWGPRNVGKSELLRYLVNKFKGETGSPPT